MALTVYLYSKSQGGGVSPVLDEVRSVLYVTDPALGPSDTFAERQALVAAAVNTAKGLPVTDGNTQYPDDYFDEELDLGPATGTMDADGDLVILSHFGKTEHIA